MNFILVCAILANCAMVLLIVGVGLGKVRKDTYYGRGSTYLKECFRVMMKDLVPQFAAYISYLYFAWKQRAKI